MGEHIKPALDYIQENKRQGDIIYVYYGGAPAFEYYQESFGFISEEIVYGIGSREDPEKYRVDVEKVRGRDRVWFIFSHNCDSCIVHEQKYYVRYLHKIGTLEDRFKVASVNVYLFDLSR